MYKLFGKKIIYARIKTSFYGKKIVVGTNVRTYFRWAERPSVFGRSGIRLGWFTIARRRAEIQHFKYKKCSFVKKPHFLCNE